MSAVPLDVLATLGRAWDRPAQGAQQGFRSVLQAMSLPGRVQRLPALALQGLEPPAPWSGALACSLLTLLDAETPLQLSPRLANPGAAAWLRFHGGVPLATQPAAWAACQAGELHPAWWSGLPLGSDEAPQDGATLLIELDGLDERAPLPGACLLRLRGPGIPPGPAQTLAVQGVPPAFWHWRRALQAQAPCGVDLLLCCGDRLAAIPRSTLLSLED